MPDSSAGATRSRPLRAAVSSAGHHMLRSRMVLPGLLCTTLLTVFCFRAMFIVQITAKAESNCSKFARICVKFAGCCPGGRRQCSRKPEGITGWRSKTLFNLLYGDPARSGAGLLPVRRLLGGPIFVLCCPQCRGYPVPGPLSAAAVPPNSDGIAPVLDAVFSSYFDQA